MTNPFGRQQVDPAEAMAKLERLQAQAEQMLASFEQAREELGAMKAEATSEDGMVRVVLDDEGGVETIEINDMAMRSLGRLNHSIMAAIRQAQIVHSAMMVELVEKMDGTGPFDLLSKMRSQMPGEVQETLRARADERRRGY